MIWWHSNKKGFVTGLTMLKICHFLSSNHLIEIVVPKKLSWRLLIMKSTRGRDSRMICNKRCPCFINRILTTLLIGWTKSNVLKIRIQIWLTLAQLMKFITPVKCQRKNVIVTSSKSFWYNICRIIGKMMTTTGHTINIWNYVMYDVQKKRGLCLMKCSSKILQNLPDFWNTKTHAVFLCKFTFPPMKKDLAYIDKFWSISLWNISSSIYLYFLKSEKLKLNGLFFPFQPKLRVCKFLQCNWSKFWLYLLRNYKRNIHEL